MGERIVAGKGFWDPTLGAFCKPHNTNAKEVEHDEETASTINTIKAIRSSFNIPRKTRAAYFGRCSVCLIDTELKNCSACFAKGYCSVEHQIQDWPEHQKQCTPLAIVETCQDEHFYRAGKELKAGTHIFNFQPIVMCPDFKKGRADGAYVCIVCCGVYKSKVGELHCPSCFWPVCSIECANKPIHAANECGIFIKANIRHYTAPHHVISAIRCILLQKSNSKAFVSLLKASQEFHGLRAIRSRAAAKEDHDLAQFLLEQRELKELLQLENKLNTKETLLKFIKVIDACTVEIPQDTKHDFRDIASSRAVPRFISAKYVLLEKLDLKTHCSPNLKSTFTYSPDLESTYITLSSTLDLSTGDIFLAAWGDEIHWGTFVRQQVLSSRFSEPCKCSRCADATENGTEFNTLRCFSCSCISVRPRDPLSKTSDWACFSAKCELYKQSIPQKTIMRKINKLRTEFGEINHMDKDEAITKLKNYFGGSYGKNKISINDEFHPRHFIIVKFGVFLALAVAHKLSESQHTMDIDFNLLSITNDLLNIYLELYEKLIPGKTEIRGKILYVQQALMATKSLQSIQSFWICRPDDENLSCSFQIRNELIAVGKLQEEALEILAASAEGTLGNDYAKKLAKMLTEIRAVCANGYFVQDKLDMRIIPSIFNIYTTVTKIRRRVDVLNPAIYVTFGEGSRSNFGF